MTGVGLLGGSFDPPHVGHLAMADQAHARLALAEVRLVPAARPPHKRDRVLAPDDARRHMLELLAAERPFLSVDDRELRRGGTSFTVDTISELRAELPGHTLFFLIGSDSLRDLPKWYRIEDLLRWTTFVTVPRNCTEVEALRETARRQFPGPSGQRLAEHVLDVEAVEVSSTEIRGRVAAGDEVQGLVPDPIAEFIREAGLYRE